MLTPTAGWFGHSGKPGSGKSPRVMLAALAECGTRAVTAAEPGRARTPSPSRSPPRDPGARHAGHADRGLYDWNLISAVTAAGADFCVRVTASLDLPVLQWLPDGSYRSYIAEPKGKNRGRRAPAAGTAQLTALPGMHVRVIDYDVPGRGSGAVITLVTSALDYQDLAAPDLAEACHQRWEIELAFDEIKTRQRGPAAILRSRSPDLVLQGSTGCSSPATPSASS